MRKRKITFPCYMRALQEENVNGMISLYIDVECERKVIKWKTIQLFAGKKIVTDLFRGIDIGGGQVEAILLRKF